MVIVTVKEVFDDLPSLETDRLPLRRLEADDLEDVFAYAYELEVAKYTSWPALETLEDSREFLNRVLELYKNGEVAPWGVVCEGKVVGTCGFLDWNRHSSQAEIGYALSSKVWGRGLMTEAVRGIIRFGFRTMKLNRIQGRCEVENIASVRVMEKAGMKLEGVLREHEYSEGKYLEIAIYPILRRDWAE